MNFLKAKLGRPPLMGEINLNQSMAKHEASPLPGSVKRKLKILISLT